MDHGGAEVDAGLVERARLGEVDAFEQLVARHLPDLHDHVARLSGNPHSDLATVTFAAVLDRLGSLRDGARFRVWLYRLAGELLAGERRAEPARPPLGLTAEQRSVWRETTRLPLRQARVLDLAVRRGLDLDEATAVVRGDAGRHLRRALRRLDAICDDGRSVYGSLPPLRAPDAPVVAARLRPLWSHSPGPAPRPSHHGLVLWGAGIAAVLLGILVPAVFSGFPAEPQAAIAPVEYTAAPFVEAAGVPTPAPEEAEVLPPLPTYEAPAQEPGPAPSPSPSPRAEPSPSPSPTETPTEEPTPQPSPTASCGPLPPLTPCTSPTEPSPSPTESETATEASGDTSG